jgi:hypothetical protein
MRFLVPWSLRSAAAVAIGLFAANGASAFFFKGWPGDGLPRERSLLPPSTQTNQPPGETEWPPYVPPGPGPGPGPNPGVPEPATAVLAAVGVGVAALLRRRKRRGG